MTAPQPDNVIQARWHFGVPIYEKALPRYGEHKARILDKVDSLRTAEQGMRRSNQGGWHSSDNLHLTEDPDLKPLVHGLLHVATACIRDFEGERSFRDVRMVGAWVNINNAGDWNAPHEHLPCTWSGVFYLDAGEPLASGDQDSLEGKILFFDPLPLGREWKRPPNIAYVPKTGSMLLFPSFLTHMVAPYYGKSPRISLAFNMVVDR